MTNPIRPSAPAAKPVAVPPAADVAPSAAASGISVESNDAVGTARPADLPSVVYSHPAGIQVETFTGLQPNVAWVDQSVPAAAGAQ